jgi:predicted transcriptional regulator
MKLPCELIVMHVLPTARGALAKELVGRHGMTQVQVAALFGVTNAAVSQYLKGVRGGNSVIDRSEYRSDFYEEISRIADKVAAGEDVTACLCTICRFVKECGLLKALYVLEGCSPDKLPNVGCPKYIIDIDSPTDET